MFEIVVGCFAKFNLFRHCTERLDKQSRKDTINKKNIMSVAQNLLLVLLLFISTNNLFAAPKKVVRNITISGVGTYVNNYDVLTSYSAISGCKSINVLGENNEIKEAKLLGSLDISKGNIAFLRTNNRNKQYIVVGSFSTSENDQVSITDLSEDLNSYVKIPGSIVFVGDDKHDIEFISNEAKKGNSGSPLYNSKGYMIGVLKGISTSNIEGRRVTATSMKTIRNFAIKNRIRLSRPPYYGKDQTQAQDFYDNYGVNISCFSKDKNGNLKTVGSFGTGVFINPDDVMTNAHVVDDCDVINVITKKKTYKAKLIKKLPEKQGDIAFLRTSAKKQKFAYYDDRLPRVGEKIFFPFFTKDRGVFKKSIGDITYIGQKNHGLEISAPNLKRVIPGAPVFDQKGRLIGTLATKLNYDMKKTLLIATPASNIMDFANKSRVKILSNRVARYGDDNNNEKALIKIICNSN